jgi:hypothetical protein
LTIRAARHAPVEPRHGGFAIDIASAADEKTVRELLRNASFGGDVRISLEREADSALAASIEGDDHRVLIARHARSGATAGVASRSVRAVFVNGVQSRVAYLGQLRIDPRFTRHRGLLAAGFARLRALQSSSAPQLHLASVVSDNVAARRLLSRRAPGWPTFEPVDTLVSLAIPARGRNAGWRSSNVRCERGSIAALNAIVSCLERNGARFQFHPSWSRADLTGPRTRGLSLDDFIVARRDGNVVGCVACWDQRGFKQVRVRGYSPRLSRWRPIVNAFSRITGAPHLPRVGDALRFAYLSHLAVDDREDERVTVDLVAAGVEIASWRGLDYVVVGLSAAHPSLAAVRQAFSHRAYESILYVAFWPDAAGIAESLDRRPSHPELAIL